MKEDVLAEVAAGTLSPKQAYKMVYKKKRIPRRAHFMKVNVVFARRFWLNLVMKTLFLLPTPLSFMRFFLKRILKKNEGLSNEELREITSLLKSRPIKIFLKSPELKLIIKTI